MAIDTAAKRKSCIGLALLFLRPGIVPNGSNLAAGERLHTEGLYAGIAANGPAAVSEDVDLGYRAAGELLHYRAAGELLHYRAG